MTREEQQDLLEQAICLIEQDGNIEQGVACLLRAAEAGLPEAMFLYAQYLHIEQNEVEEAATWYKRCYSTGYELDLREAYRSGSDAFRAAIDARFSADEKKRMRIRPQSAYDLQARLFFLLFCGGAGFRFSKPLNFPHAPWVGMGLGLLVAACLWKRITYTRVLSLGEKRKKW